MYSAFKVPNSAESGVMYWLIVSKFCLYSLRVQRSCFFPTLNQTYSTFISFTFRFSYRTDWHYRQCPWHLHSRWQHNFAVYHFLCEYTHVTKQDIITEKQVCLTWSMSFDNTKLPLPNESHSLLDQRKLLVRLLLHHHQRQIPSCLHLLILISQQH